jgi:hypothetical protein
VNTGEPDYLLELEHRQAKSAVKYSAFNKFAVAMTFVLDATVLWDRISARRSLPSDARCANVAHSLRRQGPHIKKRGDPCQSSTSGPIGQRQRARKSYAPSSTQIALSMTSSAERCHWTRTATQSPIRALANRLPPQSIFTTWTSRNCVWNGALLTGPFDAMDADVAQFRCRVRWSCSGP